MRTEAARTGPNGDVVAQILSAGERLTESIAEAIRRGSQERGEQAEEEDPQAEKTGAASEPKMNRTPQPSSGLGARSASCRLTDGVATGNGRPNHSEAVVVPASRVRHSHRPAVALQEP
jgi:hypothetical protein